MKNLENYGVQELNAREIQETDGGIFGLDDLLIGAALLIIGDIIVNWDDFKKGLSGN